MAKNVDYPFKEYIAEEEPQIKMIKKYTYYEKSGEEYVIAGIYPEIKKIELLERTLKELFFDVTFSLSNEKKKLYSCEIGITVKNRSLRFVDNTFRDCIQDNSELIGNKPKYTALCKRYFRYVLTNELSQFDDYAFLTGWEGGKTDKMYISVNTDGSWDDRYLDNGIFCGFTFDKQKNLKCRIKRTESELLNLSESDVISYTKEFRLLFRSIMNCKELMGIFAYTVHSILWYYCADGKGTWTPLSPNSPICQSVFSICICGKNINDIKCIADIFSNIFYVNIQNKNRNKEAHSISSTSLNNTFLTWRRWHSIPVIVTNKGNRLNRNNSIIKKIHRYRRKGILYFFPVYLNLTPINADQNEDFNIDHVMAIFESSKDFQLLKDEISYLLLIFVLFLSTISEESYNKSIDNKKAFNRIHHIYQTTIQNLKDSGDFSQDEQMNFALLYSAIRGFCCFLRLYMKLDIIADQLEQQAYTFFLKDIPDEDAFSLENMDTSVNNDLITLIAFNNYLKYLFTISEKDKPFTYYIEDEKRGLQETCYYLESKYFYKYFLIWNNKQGHISITESKLKETLRNFDLLIMRSNGKQFACERWHTVNEEKRKYSLLIIRKSKLEKLIEDISH